MCAFHASSECSVRNKTIICSAFVLVYDADMDTGARGRFPLNLFPSENLLLPSATKLRRLCFYKRVSVHGGGEYLTRYTPLGPGAPPGPGTPPGTQYTPGTRYTPQDQVHPPGPGTPHPPGPGTPPQDQACPPGTRHTRTPPGPGTPPRPGTPLDQVVHPPPRYRHCCRRYAPYWNAFLFYKRLMKMPLFKEARGIDVFTM